MREKVMMMPRQDGSEKDWLWFDQCYNHAVQLAATNTSQEEALIALQEKNGLSPEGASYFLRGVLYEASEQKTAQENSVSTG